MLYRIMTEDINRDSIIAIVAELFESFTIIPAIGFYRGKPENSIIIEIEDCGSNANRMVLNISDHIRRRNKQHSVLVSKIETESRSVL